MAGRQDTPIHEAQARGVSRRFIVGTSMMFGRLSDIRDVEASMQVSERVVHAGSTTDCTKVSSDPATVRKVKRRERRAPISLPPNFMNLAWAAR